KDPVRHVIAVREDTAKLHGWGALDTVLISRRSFAPEDVERARIIAADAHMEAIYLPGNPPSNAFGELLSAPDPRAFLATYRYDVSAVSDDRPFFFYTVQPRDVWDFLRNASKESADYKINRAVPLLFGLMGISVLATTLVLLLPRWILGSRLP